MKRNLMIAMLCLFPLMSFGDDLRSVIIAYRPDLLTVAQKTFLRNKIDEYTIVGIDKDALKSYEVFVDGSGNTWRVMWWSVKQFKRGGLSVTLAEVKTKLKESQYADRLKIAVCDRGKAIETIEAQGWTRPPE